MIVGASVVLVREREWEIISRTTAGQRAMTFKRPQLYDTHTHTHTPLSELVTKPL